MPTKDYVTPKGRPVDQTTKELSIKYLCKYLQLIRLTYNVQYTQYLKTNCKNLLARKVDDKLRVKLQYDYMHAWLIYASNSETNIGHIQFSNLGMWVHETTICILPAFLIDSVTSTVNRYSDYRKCRFEPAP
jgi:hypothetical protein